MVDLLEAIGSDEPEYPQTLEQVRLGTDPTFLLLFTKDVDIAALHYLSDPEAGGYVICPGANCPLCYCGKASKQVCLLPVVDVASRSVRVLRVSKARNPGALLSALLPHLEGGDLVDKLFAVARNGAKFTVTVQALGPNADRCTAVVQGFLEARKQGLDLLSAFASYSATDLADVAEVRRLLDACGGWDPKGSGNAPAP